MAYGVGSARTPHSRWSPLSKFVELFLVVVVGGGGGAVVVVWCVKSIKSLLSAELVAVTVWLTGNDGKPLSQAEAYDPAVDTWTALPNMYVPLCSCSFTSFDGRLYVIGGLTVGGPSASLQLLSLN